MIHIPHVTGALPVYFRLVEIPVRSELQLWMLLSSNDHVCDGLLRLQFLSQLLCFRSLNIDWVSFGCLVLENKYWGPDPVTSQSSSMQQEEQRHL